MSDSHDEPTPFGEGVGRVGGFIVLFFIGLIVLSGFIEAGKWIWAHV